MKLPLHSSIQVDAEVFNQVLWILYTEDHTDIYGEDGDTAAKEALYGLALQHPSTFTDLLTQSIEAEQDLVDFLRSVFHLLYHS